MLKVCLVFFLFASVYSESARETETWMPMKTTQTSVVTTHGRLESSGDFGFTDGAVDGDNEDDIDLLLEDGEDYDDEDDVEDEDFSGSGEGASTVIILNKENVITLSKPDVNDNKIPEQEDPFRPQPTMDEIELTQNNEILLRKAEPQPDNNHPNVLMAHASDDSIFNKTEVLAALIAGGAVGLLFAVFLILLLIYRMKKKDEGSYDLGKKPIYKKAPTTEIYA